MPTIIQVSAPSGFPVDKAAARSHGKIDLTGDSATDAEVDALLDTWIAAFTTLAETELGRPILTRSYEAALDRFPSGAKGTDIQLGTAGVTEVTSVKYTPPAGGAQLTLSSTVYELHNLVEPALLVLQPDQSWPDVQLRRGAVVVLFVAGWANAAAVPASIKIWILAHVADLNRNREASVEKELRPLPYLSSLLDPYRVHTFA